MERKECLKIDREGEVKRERERGGDGGGISISGKNSRLIT